MALVGAPASEVQARQEARPSTLGELLDMSEPAINASWGEGGPLESAVEGSLPVAPSQDDELGLG